jgi:hypothetical protein
MNVVILVTPKQFSGISIGMTTLLRIIGSAMGPALADMYIQTYQRAINISDTIRYFQLLPSLNMRFVTAVIVSIVSMGLTISLWQKVTKMKIPNLI